MNLHSAQPGKQAGNVGRGLLYTTPEPTEETIGSNKYKNSLGDEIANANFYAVRPEATRIR